MKRHRFDPFSLLFGALFAGMGFSYLLGSTIADSSRVVWPIVSLVVGGTIVAWGVTTILRQRSADVGASEPDVEPQVPVEDPDDAPA